MPDGFWEALSGIEGAEGTARALPELAASTDALLRSPPAAFLVCWE